MHYNRKQMKSKYKTFYKFYENKKSLKFTKRTEKTGTIYKSAVMLKKLLVMY